MFYTVIAFNLISKSNMHNFCIRALSGCIEYIKHECGWNQYVGLIGGSRPKEHIFIDIRCMNLNSSFWFKMPHLKSKRQFFLIAIFLDFKNIN